MYGTEPRFNEIHERKRKIYLDITNKCQQVIKDECQTDQQGFMCRVKLRVVPIFLRDCRASEARARVKITPREKGETPWEEGKMRDYRQSPSF